MRRIYMDMYLPQIVFPASCKDCRVYLTPGCSKGCEHHPKYDPKVAERNAAAYDKDRKRDAANPYNGLGIVTRRSRDDSFFGGGVPGFAHKPKSDTRGTCPICGTLDTLVEFEGQKLCQSCLEGLADSTPAPVGGEVVLNCTPHPITCAGQTFQPSGTVPRVAVQQIEDGEIAGCPCVRTVYGAVEGLPAPIEGTTYIVSALVLSALSGSRLDVVAPDTSPASVIRDETGRIVGVRRFTR